MIRGRCRIPGRHLIGAISALVILAGPAPGQELVRADPALRFLVVNREVLTAPAAEPRIAPDAVTPVPGLLDAALQREPGRVWVRVLVRVGAGGESALRRVGGVVGTRAGDIVTARVPLDAVPSLLTEPGIRAMEAAAPLAHLGRPGPLPRRNAPAGPDPVATRPGPRTATTLPGAPFAPNDSANVDARFDELRRRVDESWEGLVGQGVIMGVYDSGLDLTHDDFLDPAGGTRVLFAWDQTDGDGAGPGAVGGHFFDYGIECTGHHVDAGSCPMVDRVGHGTHVTGTAVADGSATGRDQPAWRFPGGAPGADLIVVKGGEGVYTTDRLVDGVAYIFARAEALGRPAVVNISLSSQSGPHDGTTLVEQALSSLSGPGRIIVAGAGNAGDHRNTFPVATNGPIHAQGTEAGSHQVLIPSYQPRPGEVNDGVLLELWYDGADSLAITVTTPRGDALTVETGDTASVFTPGGAIAVQNALDGPAPVNGDHAALIGILDGVASAPPDSGRWRIDIAPTAVHAGGEYHLWITGATFDTPTLTVLEGGTTNRYLVGVPATADRVIAAGAHVTRHRWFGVQDGVQSFPVREPLGDIAYFSSPGPRRDGVPKPDLTAPGKVLVSALSRDATLWNDFPWLVESDSVHAGLLGTSMASPQVAAAVAILLQLEPELAPEEARDALRLNAATDAFVATPTPHPVWGAGKLDVAGAARSLRPEGLGGADRPVTLSENPVRSDALVIGYRQRPESMAVYTLVAERVRTFSQQELGPLSAVWPLDTDEGGAVANGVYVLVVDLPGGGEPVLRKIFVARP